MTYFRLSVGFAENDQVEAANTIASHTDVLRLVMRPFPPLAWRALRPSAWEATNTTAFAGYCFSWPELKLYFSTDFRLKIFQRVNILKLTNTTFMFY